MKMTFGEAVEELINDNKITIEQFAKSVEIDISEVYRFIGNQHLPNFINIIKIADYYNYSVDYLLGYVPYQEKAVYKDTPPFSESFRKLLNDRHLSRYRLSKDIKISLTRIDDWYHGKRMISLDNAIKLKNHFQITIDELLCRI